MAKTTADPCMFCGGLPCECSSPQKKTVRAAKTKIEDTKLSENIPSIKRVGKLDKIKQSALSAPVFKVPEPQKSRVNNSISEDELILNSAIQALRVLMSDNQLREYESILLRKPSNDEEKILWKLRRNDREIHS